MTWHARMIAADAEFDGAPLLRREFRLEEGHGAVRAAALTLSALGVVEATLNGRPVSGDLLTPGWTSYEWRVRYAEVDVTALLDAESVLGLALGNGWYRGRLAWGGRRAVYGDALGAIAELLITYEDGFEQWIGTTDPGPPDRARCSRTTSTTARASTPAAATTRGSARASTATAGPACTSWTSTRRR
jgi:alpha-L-rhamnosidase